MEEGAKKVKELAPAPHNPRLMTEQKFLTLQRSMETFGDLSGVVFNVRTMMLVGGHQRVKNLSPDDVIEKSPYTDDKGTVALGYITRANGERWNYREVDWDETTERAANIAANKIHAEFDPGLLSDIFADLKDVDFDLGLTGFSMQEIFETELSTKGGGHNAGGAPAPGDGGFSQEPVVSYTVIFDNESQHSAFLNYLRLLKARYPDLDTIGARLVRDLEVKWQNS